MDFEVFIFFFCQEEDLYLYFKVEVDLKQVENYFELFYYYFIVVIGNEQEKVMVFRKVSIFLDRYFQCFMDYRVLDRRDGQDFFLFYFVDKIF